MSERDYAGAAGPVGVVGNVKRDSNRPIRDELRIQLSGTTLTKRGLNNPAPLARMMIPSREAPRKISSRASPRHCIIAHGLGLSEDSR